MKPNLLDFDDLWAPVAEQQLDNIICLKNRNIIKILSIALSAWIMRSFIHAFPWKQENVYSFCKNVTQKHGEMQNSVEATIILQNSLLLYNHSAMRKNDREGITHRKFMSCLIFSLPTSFTLLMFHMALEYLEYKKPWRLNTLSQNTTKEFEPRFWKLLLAISSMILHGYIFLKTSNSIVFVVGKEYINLK